MFHWYISVSREFTYNCSRYTHSCHPAFKRRPKWGPAVRCSATDTSLRSLALSRETISILSAWADVRLRTLEIEIVATHRWQWATTRRNRRQNQNADFHSDTFPRYPLFHNGHSKRTVTFCWPLSNSYFPFVFLRLLLTSSIYDYDSVIASRIHNMIWRALQVWLTIVISSVIPQMQEDAVNSWEQPDQEMVAYR